MERVLRFDAPTLLPPPRDPRPTPRGVLIVTDDASTRSELQRSLRDDPRLRVEAAATGEEALRLLAGADYNLALTDLRLPDMNGVELLKEMQLRNLPVAVVLLTGAGDVGGAVRALHLGAYDFLARPIDLHHLGAVVRRVMDERDLRDELNRLRNESWPAHSFQGVLSKNPAMHAVFQWIDAVAPTDAPVLIEGEPGTGKGWAARAVHDASRGRNGSFAAVNCAALPETLLASELFGHEKGAFPGAVGQRRGRFETAHGGTLFLDEIGDIPASLQAKLVRVLQERRFERVGGAAGIEAEVRVIASTGRNLKRLVAQRTFRADLYDRLNVTKIDLPPLRERPEDIPLLASHFVNQCLRPGGAAPRISPRAMESLLSYRWPGNVRELENAIGRACVTSRDGLVQPENLPPEVLAPSSPRPPVPIDLDRPLPEVLRDAVSGIERQYISKALKKTRGNVSRCARVCGMSRRSITGKIAEYKLDKSVFK